MRAPRREFRLPAPAGLGEQPDQGLVRQLEDLLQGADRAQRLRAPGAAGALLAVTHTGHTDFDTVARQMVLDALERQAPRGDRGARRPRGRGRPVRLAGPCPSPAAPHPPAGTAPVRASAVR
ncbi:hypothetical protein Shyhy01_10540 [Streptomyces hygroscopicus subsp. hygroscopicus]|nr:hypothetical protein Shyhy01_10540 [Streptomyces hygroscopicus subsp. hygroscopicus]